MADKNGEEQKELPEEIPFVTEQIVKRSGRKHWLLKILKTLVLAVIFGVTAGASFAFVLSYTGKREHPDEPVRESVTIPRDEIPSSAEVPTQTPSLESTTMQQPETTTEETTPEPTETTESIEQIVENVLSERSLTLEDYEAMYNAMYEVVASVNQSIVTVISAESKLDLFNQPYELKDEAAGLIFNKTDSEVLILTTAEGLHAADNIWVTFFNGEECHAVLRRADPVSGLAVLAVDSEQLGDALSSYPVAVLGNSYSMKQGAMAMTVGSPFGYNYSMSYGVVSSVKHTVQAVDVNYRVIDTNILESPAGGGFLINTKGEIMGVITKVYKSDASNGITTALAISDLKGVLERLSNDQEILYFGIKGQDVTSDIAKETEIPEGIYISEAVAGSPVYQAGVQSGDVLTEFDGAEVRSMRTYRNLLESHQAGDTVHIKVMRRGREGYTEIEFDVTVGVQ